MTDAFYDLDAIRQWRENLHPTFLTNFHPLPKCYRSNWRVLHIDGFEEHKMIQFYVPRRHEWTIEAPRQ